MDARAPPRSFSCWRATSVRTGTASTLWKSGIITPAARWCWKWLTATAGDTAITQIGFGTAQDAARLIHRLLKDLNDMLVLEPRQRSCLVTAPRGDLERHHSVKRDLPGQKDSCKRPFTEKPHQLEIIDLLAHIRKRRR